MGNTWEVSVWTNRTGKYRWGDYWRGESFIAALWHYRKAKRCGFGCVALYWR